MLLKTLKYRLYFALKIPLISFAKPKLLSVNDTQCQLQIKLSRRTKNHLNSMYFGALAIGADLAGGLLAMHHIEKSGEKISLVFKDIHGDFLKRVEGHAIFTCLDGDRIQKMIKKTVQTKERVSEKITINVTVPSLFKDEVLANFTLTLSIKKQ